MRTRFVLGGALCLAAAMSAAGLGGWLAPAPRAMSAEGNAAQSAATTETESAAEVDPLGPNGACYVCHMTFVKEEFAKVHLDAKITCVKCHGLSDKHANDENVGATKPDITFQREAIDASCDSCHKVHDVPAKTVIARFLERGLSREAKLVCIDCHGTHKIQDAESTE